MLGLAAIRRWRFAPSRGAQRPVYYAGVTSLNLSAWRETARTASQFCAAAAARGIPVQPPRTLNGVFFFANGLKECVEAEAPRK